MCKNVQLIYLSVISAMMERQAWRGVLSRIYFMLLSTYWNCDHFILADALQLTSSLRLTERDECGPFYYWEWRHVNLLTEE